MKVLDDNLKSTNTDLQLMTKNYQTTRTSIDTLETATAVLGTNLKSTNDKVDLLTNSVETLTSNMADTNSRVNSLTNCVETLTYKMDVTNNRIDGLITVMEKTEENKAKDVDLLSSVLRNISQFGQAPVNCNFVTRISHGSTESEIQTHT